MALSAVVWDTIVLPCRTVLTVALPITRRGADSRPIPGHVRPKLRDIITGLLYQFGVTCRVGDYCSVCYSLRDTIFISVQGFPPPVLSASDYHFCIVLSFPSLHRRCLLQPRLQDIPYPIPPSVPPSPSPPAQVVLQYPSPLPASSPSLPACQPFCIALRCVLDWAEKSTKRTPGKPDKLAPKKHYLRTITTISILTLVLQYCAW